MSNKNLLVELFVEELPPKVLKKLGDAFSHVLAATLNNQGLTDDHSVTTSFASPRRLAAHITNVMTVAKDKQISQKLMPVAVGLDASGSATPALLKRLGGFNLDASSVPRLKREMDGKAEALFLDITVKGAILSDGLQIAINEALAKLPIPKIMTYQLSDGWTSVNFVRPAHGLIALHGQDVLDINVLGLTAGNITQGHRFEAKFSPLMINNADSYAEQLKTDGAVIASFDERRSEIKRQLSTAASKLGLKPIDDDALLDEVTALVERPNVLVGEFETEYLEVPQECLILTMKSNQKYFPLLDSNHKLTNKFLIVSNISPSDPSSVIGGNERVVRPRLADAKFFFDQDRKKTLESRIEGLNKVVYHNKLGSQGERMLRVRAIAQMIGQQLGGDRLGSTAAKAAELAKTDLVTDMVGEFPELQGIMGRYYAQHQKIADDIAYAIEDHYKPRFAGDELPRNQIGICVALADKLETLVGMFGIGNIPTGEKDPFALRRHALGIIRLIDETQTNINFIKLIDLSINEFRNIDSFVRSNKLPLDFIEDKSVGHYENLGFSKTEIEAAMKGEASMVYIQSIRKRLEAVRAFGALPEAPALAAANKRVGNLLKKSEVAIEPKVKTALLKEPAEIALNTALSIIKPIADAAFEAGDYTNSLQSLAGLKAPVDAFFDKVMVNVDEPALKENRLGLLATLHVAMNRVADLSKLAS